MSSFSESLAESIARHVRSKRRAFPAWQPIASTGLFSLTDLARVFDVSLHALETPTAALHDPENTATPPAPGAIQIGPLDVS